MSLVHICSIRLPLAAATYKETWECSLRSQARCRLQNMHSSAKRRKGEGMPGENGSAHHVYVSENLSYSLWVAITKYHRLCGLHITDIYFSQTWVRKSKVKVLTDPGPGEGQLPGF